MGTDGDAADILDFAPGDGLSVSNERQSFQQGTGIARGFFVPESRYPGGAILTYLDTIAAGDLGQFDAAVAVILGQGGKGDSMGSQFFLVYKDSTIPSDKAGGYSVIGTIVGGMDVVEKVAAGGVLGGGTDGAPARAISITATTVS